MSETTDINQHEICSRLTALEANAGRTKEFKTMTTPLQAVEQEIKRLNGQSHEPSSANILALIQMLVDALKKEAIDVVKTKYPRE